MSMSNALQDGLQGLNYVFMYFEGGEMDNGRLGVGEDLTTLVPQAWCHP